MEITTVSGVFSTPARDFTFFVVSRNFLHLETWDKNKTCLFLFQLSFGGLMKPCHFKNNGDKIVIKSYYKFWVSTLYNHNKAKIKLI
uniref:Uncharacterized protein n=1 Tax=Lepeophtheirus salmonis TaxID=72036 RepID=A0A0K2T4W9_LEPSM